MSRWFWRGLGRGAISAKKICYATFRIIDLGRNYRQIFEFKWFIVKILINNDLGYSWMFPTGAIVAAKRTPCGGEKRS